MDQIITKSPHCSWLRGHWVTKKEFLLTISIHYLAGCNDKNEHNFFSQFVSGRYSTNPAIWLVPRAGSILPIRTAHSGSGSFRNHLLGFRKKCYSPAKVSPYWEKLCPLSCLSCFRYPRPRAQFFPIRTSRQMNNKYVWRWRYWLI